MKIKNILILTFSSMLFFYLASCDYLDKAPEAAGLDFEKVFGDSANYQRYCEMLVMIPFFLHLQNGVSPLGSHDCGISDNSISSVTYTGCPSVRASNGDYYALRSNGDAVWCNNTTWAEIWSHVRVANTGIRNISYYTGGETSKKQILGMCYFYRAWSYAELCRRWGGMPYLYAPLSADVEMDLPRLTMQETYKRAALDCDSAAMYLENVIPPTEFPHPTRVAALALKSRILLYSASDFARYEVGSGENLWEAAALAANECIRTAETSGYGLVEWENFNNVIKDIKEEYYLKEVLLGRRQNHSWGSDAYTQNSGRPPGQLAGKYGACPSAALVESFEMENGLPLDDPASGYNPQNPYVKRDPRFYLNIMYNGAVIAGKNLQIYHFNEATGKADAKDLKMSGGDPIMGYTLTGTYVNKWMGENFGSGMKVLWPYIRMAEIYLNFAEASNEAWGNPGSKDSRCLYSAEEAINKVRNRAQMPNINSKYLLKDLFRDRVRNERRVELCFEEHRVYDVRRWQIGTQPEYRDIYGYYITKLKPGSYNVSEYPTGFRYEKILVKNRVFDEKHYLFVINLDDTRIGPNFKQNPGW